MNPNAEPNSLPPLFESWQEWRETYTAYVADFQAGNKSAVDEIELKRSLRRLGYVGAFLDAELNFIKEQK